MISTNQFKMGMTIKYDGNLFSILNFQHVKPGKGGAFVRSKLKNVKTGAIIDKTWRAGEKVEQAILERTKMQYLYQEGSNCIFMDLQTYEQSTIPKEVVGEAVKYVKEGEEIEVSIYEGKLIAVEAPTFVELKVAQTGPVFKGDTAGSATKPATLETGLVVQVPVFIEVGDVLKIDTRTGEYVTRV